MTIIVGLDDLSKALIDAGKNLLSPPPSTDELLTLLDETESLLRNVDQDPPLSMQSALLPSKSALVSVDLLSHPDSDVRVSVLSCLTEIVRITAPEAPYSDDRMKDIFRLTVEAFEKLADASSSRSYRKAVSVLDNVAKVRSCLVMLDLECYDLILLMFQKFLKIIRPAHPQVVFSSMEMIMITIIDEIEEVSTNLLHILLASVKKENQNVLPMSGSLAEKVLSRCARKLKPYIIEALNSTGTSYDMYSPVVSSICQSDFDTTEVHNIVNTKENEAAEPMLGRRATTSGSLEEKLGLGHSRKENLSKSSSKRPARDGTRRINEKDKVRNGNNSSLLKQSLKQVRSESTDAETELGVTGKRGRKPNSLMNPEDYDISWLSGKRDPFKTTSNRKIHKRRSAGESSLGKVAARKTPLLKETSPATSRSLTGSLKRSRVDESDYDYDSDSLSSPRLKKLAACFRDEEPPKKESNQEEDDRKIGNSSKKIRSQNGLEKSQKTAQKSPIVEAKILNPSGKRLSVRSDAKRKNLERASRDTPVPQSSKRKKMVSQVAARKLSDESEETPKSHPTRRRTARKEVESDTNGFGEDLVGRRVNIWWPLDKTFYEGVIDSYCTRKKMHRVIYSDGDSEELNLSEERWELLEDHIIDDEDKEVDLPESIPLSDILQRQRVKKSKNVAVSVEPTSSSGLRSSSRTLHMKKETGKKLKKQVEKTREGKNVRSLRELNAETDRTAEEEEEVSLEAELDRREEQECEDDCSEKQEQSEHNGVEAEAEGKEEEKQFANSEIESESEDSESEEEPKWRETDDMEDEVEAEEEEERGEVDEKGANTSFSEIEKEEEEREEVGFSEIEKEEDEEKES
ncbi:PREDICTED: glutamic acid-rich protein-like isoform X2 [Camelina sativa]|uniref:Glutamic acid-rich protein-like isoform X2 n=1 Tax=Camelina sativa TaxID=90675 RepID=A0ABM0TQW2_CAMSA|nr:PREDICTED: glutamic acid-rich protein-like isoform X2 [Camelina sativa]